MRMSSECKSWFFLQFCIYSTLLSMKFSNVYVLVDPGAAKCRNMMKNAIMFVYR